MILDLFKLDGKVAVVTGANTGLGQGMAVALAQAGAKVLGVARRSCEDTKNKIEADGGAFAEVIADLSDMASIDVVMKAAIDTYGRVDILVNNAGIIKRCDAIDVPKQDWDSVINVNLNMVFLLCQAFAKQYVKQGDGGKIINVCSMLSFQGGIRVPAYTASKSAVMGLTKALANEWASKGIQVNAIAPIWQLIIHHSLEVIQTEARLFLTEYRQDAGEHLKICREQQYFLHQKPLTMLMVTQLLLTAAAKSFKGTQGCIEC